MQSLKHKQQPRPALHMRLPVGEYQTRAGSRLRVFGATARSFQVDFDWLEEGGCCDCSVSPIPEDVYLVWSCDYCGGGSAKLAAVETELYLTPAPVLRVDLGIIPQDMRQPIWEWMQINRPEQCEFLGSDIYIAFRYRLDTHALLCVNAAELPSIMAVFPGITRCTA